MTPCEEWLSVLDAAADGEPLPAAAGRHIDGCDACRAHLKRVTVATLALARLPYYDPGTGFTAGVLASAAGRRARPSWAATVAVLLAGGAGSSATFVAAIAAVAWLWFGPQRVTATAGYAAGELAGTLLSGAQSVLNSGPTMIACVACALAAACAAALFGVRMLAGVRRATPV